MILFLIILNFLGVGKNYESLISCPTQQLDHLCPMVMKEICQMLSLFILQVKISEVYFWCLHIMFPRIKHKYPMAVGNSVMPLYVDFLSLIPLSSFLYDRIAELMTWMKAFALYFPYGGTQANIISLSPFANDNDCRTPVQKLHSLYPTLIFGTEARPGLRIWLKTMS